MIIKYTITLEESITDEKEMPRKRRHSIMSKATSYLPGTNQAKTAGDPGGGPVYNLSKGPRKSLTKGGNVGEFTVGCPRAVKSQSAHASLINYDYNQSAQSAGRNCFFVVVVEESGQRKRILLELNGAIKVQE